MVRLPSVVITNGTSRNALICGVAMLGWSSQVVACKQTNIIMSATNQLEIISTS